MELVQTLPEHVEILAECLKPDHQRELAWFGKGNRAGVRESVAVCEGHTLSAMHAGALLFIAGVQQRPWLHDDAAVITYLATTNFDRHVRAALRMTRRLFAIEAWKHTPHRRIEQYVPPPYAAGINFLKKLFGWADGGLVMVGARQAIHLYFERE